MRPNRTLNGNVLKFTFLLVYLASCASPNRQKIALTTAYVLGSIHSNMLDQPHYSLRDFVAALYLFEPTVILNEVRPEFPGPVEGSIDGGSEQAIVYAFAEQKHARVIPVDWFDDNFIAMSEQEDARMSKALKHSLEPLDLQFRKIVRTGSFKDSQLDSTQKLIRARYGLMAKNGLTSAELRNQTICTNIKKYKTQLIGERVMVVFGLAHKYYLEDCLRDIGIQQVNIESWYDPSKVNQFSISKILKQEAVKSFLAAKSLLRNRLSNGYYKLNTENLSEKLKEFDDWIAKTNVL